jgi:hypothetical protein
MNAAWTPTQFARVESPQLLFAIPITSNVLYPFLSELHQIPRGEGEKSCCPFSIQYLRSSASISGCGIAVVGTAPQPLLEDSSKLLGGIVEFFCAGSDKRDATGSFLHSLVEGVHRL